SIVRCRFLLSAQPINSPRMQRFLLRPALETGLEAICASAIALCSFSDHISFSICLILICAHFPSPSIIPLYSPLSLSSLFCATSLSLWPHLSLCCVLCPVVSCSLSRPPSLLRATPLFVVCCVLLFFFLPVCFVLAPPPPPTHTHTPPFSP